MAEYVQRAMIRIGAESWRKMSQEAKKDAIHDEIHKRRKKGKISSKFSDGPATNMMNLASLSEELVRLIAAHAVKALEKSSRQQELRALVGGIKSPRQMAGCSRRAPSGVGGKGGKGRNENSSSKILAPLSTRRKR